MPATRRELKKFIRELENIRGRHTELVSVYVPAGYDIIKIIQHLQEEQGTAKNIKDAKTRGNVIDSLERCVRHLRLFKQTPENGLALFAGNVSAQEGKVDIQVWSIEPPEPLTTRMYRCDQTFVLDLLRQMMEAKEVYGLIVMDRREATLGFLKGTLIQKTHSMTSGVPGKIKAGGQSAMRYERIREGMAIEFYKRIAEACANEFLDKIVKKELKGILLGGPGPTKEEFKDYLNNDLKKRIIAIQDLTYTDESGLEHLVEKSKDVLAKEVVAEEKALLLKFFEGLAKDGPVTYGEEKVKKALSYGVAEVILVSEDVDDSKIEELEREGDQYGTTVKIISTETTEGKQFRDLSGFGALLRYKLEL
jgi:peptide chain release factor subunit 1